MAEPVKPRNSREAMEMLEHLAGHGLALDRSVVEVAVSTVAGAVDFQHLLDHQIDLRKQFEPSMHGAQLALLHEGRLHPEKVHQRHADFRSAWLLVTRSGTDGPVLQEWLRDLEAQLARSVVLDRASDVIAAFSEMIDNAQEHGRSKEHHTLTFERGNNWWIFSVTDGGIGIPETIRTLPQYKGISDFEAISEALKEGVSCTQESGRGGGFRQLIRILVDNSSMLHMRTGFASVHIHGNAAVQRLDQTVFSRARRGLHLRARGTLS